MGKSIEINQKSEVIGIASVEEWWPFEAATRVGHPEGSSPRATVICEFMRWYMRRLGARLPERPAAGFWSEVDPAERPWTGDAIPRTVTANENRVTVD